MRLTQTVQFKRDMKRQIKKGKDPKKLIKILEFLIGENALPSGYLDHPLKGRWKGRRDCHIESDWVLIYRVSKNERRLERTGSHSDLF
ncbi:type II toxin-antitoxin system YafQ family toxin [bacterium]|jgi:mRNA interferase YafQ|nr:type II toxin-antitoxin system YafQ family toxin [Verrucomicrobiota bacterium]MDA7632743.1 type II toxin-antitoxin system YafQ family toxin [bacterium]